MPPDRLWQALLLEYLSRSIFMLEYVLIGLGVGLHITYLQAYAIGGLTSLIQNVIFIVPFEVGTKEGSLYLFFRLLRRDAALAYAFGVGVDVDHVVKAPFYLRAVGLRDKRGYYWRSSLQEPVALLWIVPLSIFLGTVVPLVFFAIHIAMDYSVRFEKMPLYPYSPWVTRGWLTHISDRVKEGVP